MSIRLVTKLLVGSLLLSSATVQADPFTISNIGSGTFIMNNQGLMTADHDSTTAAPYIRDTSGNEAPAGSLHYAVSGLNSNGDLVGTNSVYGDNGRYTYYFFFTKRGQESVVLKSLQSESYYAGSIAINDSSTIAISSSDKVEFFNESTKTAEVAPGSNNLFDSTKSIYVLSNGDVLAPILVAATPKWARVSSSGIVTILPDSVLPASASIDKILSDGRVLFFLDSEMMTSDLISAATSVSLPAGTNRNLAPLTMNASGQILATDARNSGDSRLSGAQSMIWLLQGGKQPMNLTCMLPNKQRFHLNYATFISDNGFILGGLSDHRGKHSYNKSLLSPTGSVRANNYCVSTTIKVIGSCKQYFNGLTQRKTMPKSMTCQIQVRIKDSKGRAVSGANVATSSYSYSGTVQRGRTDSSGQLTFSIKSPEPGVYASTEILAPYNSSKWLGNTATLYFNY